MNRPRQFLDLLPRFLYYKKAEIGYLTEEYFKDLCQHYLKNFNLTIEYFEELISKHNITLVSQQQQQQQPENVVDTKILDIRCYAELNDTQKVLVDKEKYFYYSFDDLKTIIPDVNVYDKLDMERLVQIATLSKEASRNQDQVGFYFFAFLLVKTTKVDILL